MQHSLMKAEPQPPRPPHPRSSCLKADVMEGDLGGVPRGLSTRTLRSNEMAAGSKPEEEAQRRPALTQQYFQIQKSLPFRRRAQKRIL